jgi:hypothetical protein
MSAQNGSSMEAGPANGGEMNAPESGTMHSTPATIQVRVIVRRAGLEDLVMVLPDAMSIASVRQQIGQSELPLVHVPTGTLVENDMQLHQLADTRGEVLLELLMSDEVKAGAAAADSSGSKRGFGQTIVGALTWIGAITVVVIIIYAVRLYTKWSASRKTMVVGVPADAQSPAAAAAAPAAAAPAAAAK